MPSAQIVNAAGAYGLPIGTGVQSGDQQLIEVVNGAAVTLKTGDVVVWDISTVALAKSGRVVTTTTTANDVNVAGVVSRQGNTTPDATAIPVGAAFMLCVGGIALVQVASQTTAAGGLLGSFTTAKVADDTATAAGSILGVALTASSDKDANNCIVAKINIS